MNNIKSVDCNSVKNSNYVSLINGTNHFIEDSIIRAFEK